MSNTGKPPRIPLRYREHYHAFFLPGDMHCPYCGQEHPENARFCASTGQAIAQALRTCPTCGKVVQAKWKRCPYCTASLRPWRWWVPRIGVIFVLFIVGGLFLWSNTPGSNEAPISAPELPTATSTPRRPTPTRFPINRASSSPTSLLSPTPSPALTTAPPDNPWLACSGSYLSRLHVGDRASVALKPPLANRVRSEPGTNGTIIGRIQPGEEMTILDGPACENGWVWWRVQAKEGGLIGWTSEGDSENYWLVPLP